MFGHLCVPGSVRDGTPITPPKCTLIMGRQPAGPGLGKGATVLKPLHLLMEGQFVSLHFLPQKRMGEAIASAIRSREGISVLRNFYPRSWNCTRCSPPKVQACGGMRLSRPRSSGAAQSHCSASKHRSQLPRSSAGRPRDLDSDLQPRPSWRRQLGVGPGLLCLEGLQ